jgi:hypothetical protein
MNGPVEATNSQGILSTPRTSLQNIGEKREEDENNRDGNSFQAFGADGFTFLDFLDIINPLQHIPVVGTLYRSITGDEIDPGARIAGGTLFGGPIGTVVAMADVTIEGSTGQDMGEHMMALFGGEEGDTPADNKTVMLANSPPPAEFVTAAGEQISATSPISTNAEVLDWARRETARTTEAAGEANLKRTAPIPPTGSFDVAANIEVLNWARQETALSRSAVENANAGSQDIRRAAKQARDDGRQAALSNTIAAGRDQSQLNGATAPLGGWFSETMILALAKYDDGAQLGKSSTDRRVEPTLDITE